MTAKSAAEAGMRVVAELLAPMSGVASEDVLTLEKLLMRELPADFPSRGAVKRARKRGCLIVGGQQAKEQTVPLEAGQRVTYVFPEPRGPAYRPAQEPSLKLKFAHVDDWCAACIKPTGFAVQSDSTATTLRAALDWALPPPLSRPDALRRPKAVHRIDKATGGLLLVARTSAASAALASALGEGAVAKTYLALVAGRLDGEGTVDAPLQGKSALSRWVALQHAPSAAFGCITMVRLHPETGRFHQLRQHMAMLGTPILGDRSHMPKEARASELDEMYLFASEIKLASHPGKPGEPLHISAELPLYFKDRLVAEAAAAMADPVATALSVAHADARARKSELKLTDCTR